MYSVHIDTARTWRGGQNQVLLTALGLRAAGHRALLIVHPEGELRLRVREGGDVLPLAPRMEMDFAAAWRLSRLIRSERPDVVHAHDPHGVAMAALALSMDTSPRRPLLVASRRVDFSIKRNTFSQWKYRQVDVFVCASDAIRRVLADGQIDAGRTVTVHEGIDVAHVDAAQLLDVHSEFWLPHGAPIAGNVAALTAHKGQRDLIDAAALVIREIPDARFLIFGEGELRPALEQQIRSLRLQKHVLMPGFRPDVLSLLKSVDVFVLSSIAEGLGTSILDAMACRKPVVATRVGGIPEIVFDRETGSLVPPRAPDALAAAIIGLLADQGLRTRWGDAGRRRVERQFTAEQMVAQTLDVYARWAGTRREADTAGPPGRG